MQVVNRGRSLWLWIFALLFFFLQLPGKVSASTSAPTLPAPLLEVLSRSRDSVLLVCRAPAGHLGVVFMLYNVTEKVDTLELQSAMQGVQFTLGAQAGISAQTELFCCLYKNKDGIYSAFSPYLHLEHQQGVAPTGPTPSFPTPVLSVEPSSGRVKRGDTLSFHCFVPTLQPQSQLPSSGKKQPISFMLLRAAERTGATSLVLQPQATQVSNSMSQLGAFTVGPVEGGEGGSYTCLYQIRRRRNLLNSTVSNMVQVTIAEVLPVPTLVLQQQAGLWHLSCTGSPAYPGAVFSLYLVDNQVLIASQNAPLTHYQAAFPVPVQDTPSGNYQCQYSVLLGREWSHSERSLPLVVSTGPSPPPSPDQSGVDWPLVLGSFSAVVLFLCSVAVVAVVAHRKLKASDHEKQKRQEAQFWTQVHTKDYAVDLTLRPTSSNPQEWNSEGTPETAFRSSLWNPFSTFTAPIH
ncbi:uncharacterized protein LOC143016103 [Genypterus blacodes]|uniref:uncharacterized protein LOC143016103 n=1 Tax=Genypterus blacodes TaxID=154954 RepID=UPI003F761495